MSADLVLIRRFEAVHRLASFSRAADELSITHSALTKSIRTLEEQWDVRLFERTTRSVVPTEAGRRLALAAVDLIAQFDAVKADVVAGDRQLSIICGAAVIDTLIHGALAAFRTRHPLVSVTIETMPPDIACDRLVRRQAHLLLFHSTTVKALQPHKALRVERVVSEPYVMAFRPGHPVEQGDLSFDHILAFDWAVAGFDKAYQASLPKPLRDMFSHHGFPRYRVLNQSACIELAMRSDMLTLLPSTVAASLVADRRLRSLPFPGDARFAISAVTPVASAPSPTVIDFIAAVRATFAG